MNITGGTGTYIGVNMSKVLKGVNVIVAPKDKQGDVFGGIYMAGVVAEPGKKDVRTEVPIHNNKEVMSESDIKVFKRVFNQIVAAYKRAEDIKDPEPKKAKKSAQPSKKPASKKPQKKSKKKSKRK